MKPATTCDSECCRNIMRLVPTVPAKTRMTQNHHSGLKAKSMENATKAPSNPPIAAVCVEIFHQTFTTAHTTCMSNAATRMLAMNCGTWK